MAAFSWKVAVQGYVWGDDYSSPDIGDGQFVRRGGQRVLRPVTWEFKTYQPLKEDSGLFRTFASTPLTEDGIREFADRYGHLGEGAPEFWWSWSKDDEAVSDEEREENAQYVDVVSVPQSFQEWEAAILRMRRAVEVWDQVRNTKTVNAKSINELQEIVDRQLDHVRVVTRFEIGPPRTHQPAMHVVPSTLAGAMWLQLVQAIVANKKFRACETCGRWFELSPATARKSKHYCDDACRSRAYRARKERARQLAAEGRKPKEIARELGSDVKTINNWLRHKE